MKRFKKLLVLASTLALVAALAVPMAALAADLTSVSIVLTDYTKSADPEHTVAFTTATEIGIGGTITITYPSEFTGIGSIVDDDVTVTGLGGTATSSEAGSGQVITITIATDVVATAQAVTVVIGDGGGGGLNDITSPSVAGTYTISIATSVGDSLDVDVNITETGTTTVTGDLPNVIEVAAPTGFAMPSLDPSNSPVSSPSKDIVVSANGSSTWILQAHESGGGDDGKMASIATPADKLATVMRVDASGGGDTDLSLSGAAQTLASAQGPLTDTISVYFRQAVAYGDTVHTDYSITVTFTAGFEA